MNAPKKILNKAAKLILKLSKRATATEALLTPLAPDCTLSKVKVLAILHKSLYGIVPYYIHKLFNIKQNSENRDNYDHQMMKLSLKSLELIEQHMAAEQLAPQDPNYGMNFPNN